MTYLSMISNKHCSTIRIPLRIGKSPTDMIGNRVQFTVLGKVIGEKSQNKVNIFFNIFHIKHLQLQSSNFLVLIIFMLASYFSILSCQSSSNVQQSNQFYIREEQ